MVSAVEIYQVFDLVDNVKNVDDQQPEPVLPLIGL